MNTTIGIAGFGFVGQAIYAAAKSTDNVFVYDKYKEEHNDFDNISDCEYIFICLPSPTLSDGKQELSEISEVFNKLMNIDYEGIVIVKSTVIPEFLDEWSEALNIVANPEFLNQNFAAHDFEYQTLVLLGGDATHCCDVRDMYAEEFHLPNAEYHITTIYEAMEFKYVHNTYHAYNVLFWNYVQQVYGNARKHTALYQLLYNRVPIMSQVAADGKLGYGGACFPKDVMAAEGYNPHALTKFMIEYNKKLRG